MKSKQESLWPMLLTVLALAVIGLVYFRGLQEPINSLHDIQLPSNPTPLAASPEDNPARPAKALVVNPIEQTQAGRQPTTVASATDDSAPLDAAMSPPEQPFASALETLVGSEAFSQLFVSDDFINRMVVTVDRESVV